MGCIYLPRSRQLCEVSDSYVIQSWSIGRVDLWYIYNCVISVMYIVRHVLKENGGDLELAAERLIREAEARDTQDNVSLIICAFNQA